MTPVPIVPESHSVKFTFQQLEESFRIFAILETDSPVSMKEMVDSTGRTFFVALQNPGWISSLSVTVHRSQQSLSLRTALIEASQDCQEILVRDYDTAQIYKAHILTIDPKHRTRVKWSDEYFHFVLAIFGEGVFNVENESEITWRSDTGTLVPERGYPY